MALNALYVGSTGLNVNSTALDMIGNNLANINTSGYKNQRMLFKDVVYQTLSAGSGPSPTVGGSNPIQLGFGVGIGSIDTIFQQGNLTPTGRNLDAGIQGDGFFVLNDGNRNLFARAGSFSIDAAGFLIDPGTGFRVQRFGNVGETTATAPGFQTAGDSRIRVPFGAGVSGVPSSIVNYQGNLASTIPIGESVTTAIQIFDSQSTPQSLNVTFTKTAVNSYSVTGTVSGGGTVTIPATPVTFDTSGLLVSPATLTANISGIPGTVAQDVTLNLGTPGQAIGLTQFGGVSTATAVTQDGSGAGVLVSISFDQSGIVQGVFSNGRNIPIAQLAIAAFNNQGGLLREGSNFFVTSAASGEALIGVAGGGGRGLVRGGTLEGSNVDIATEFSRLIIAQRGFQVNARTVTVANDTLQELANIVR